MNKGKRKHVDAMIIIDMQRGLIDAHPPREDTQIARIKELAYVCRLFQIPVIYVRHDGGPGDELEKNTHGWEISRRLYPQFGEKVFDKYYNSAFKETGLHEYLQRLQAKRVILCGMQTEYCIDTTVKVAFEYGYDVVIPKGTVTTFDQEFCDGISLTEYYEECIWNGRFASVLSMKEIVSELQG